MGAETNGCSMPIMCGYADRCWRRSGLAELYPALCSQAQQRTRLLPSGQGIPSGGSSRRLTSQDR